MGASLACAGLAIGSFGPWGGDVFGYSGIGNNGSLTLLAAGLAAFAVWRWTTSLRRSAAIGTLILGVLCVTIAAHDMLDIRDLYVSSDDWAWIDGVAWGLGLVLLSGTVLVLLSVPLYRRSSPASDPSLNRRQRALATGVGAVFLIGLWSVASSDPKRSDPGSLFLQGPGNSSGARGIAEGILTLRPGTSAESAMARLGPPEAVHLLEDASIFQYGPWQLIFTGRGLRDRIRYSVSAPGPSVFSRAYDRKLRVLDRKIRRLRPGVRIDAVKARLGRPEAIEVYGTSMRRNVALWYGEWRLDFADGTLKGRYK